MTSRIRLKNLIAVGCFGLLAWVITFNMAYVNGDDVVHLSDSQVHTAFRPRLVMGWIPNRQFDLYGRTVLTLAFDAIYFPLKQWFGPGLFFWLHKAFSASLHAAFLVFVLLHLRSEARFYAGFIKREAEDRCMAYLSFIAVAIGLLVTFKWENQVQFICYQIPAAICFAYLACLGRAFAACLGDRDGISSPNSLGITPPTGSTLLLLSFLGAFSLESYALQIGATTALAIAIISFIRFRRFITPGPFPECEKVRSRHRRFLADSAVALLFCVFAIYIAIRFSDRTSRDEAIGLSEGFLRIIRSDFSQDRSVVLFAENWKFLIKLAMIGLGALLVAGTGTVRRLFTALKSRHLSVFRPSRPVLAGIATLGCCLGIGYFVVLVVSLKSGTNYFLDSIYPWGGLLLVNKLIWISIFAFLLFVIERRSSMFNGLIAIGIFVMLSIPVVQLLDDARRGFLRSVLINNAYMAMVRGERDALQRTGLSPTKIRIEVRPLPTADSPPWFVDQNGKMFSKYLDVKALPEIK